MLTVAYFTIVIIQLQVKPDDGIGQVSHCEKTDQHNILTAESIISIVKSVQKTDKISGETIDYLLCLPVNKLGYYCP